MSAKRRGRGIEYKTFSEGVVIRGPGGERINIGKLAKYISHLARKYDIPASDIYSYLFSANYLDISEVINSYFPATYLPSEIVNRLDSLRYGTPTYDLALDTLGKICLRYETYNPRAKMMIGSKKASCVVIFNEDREKTDGYTAKSSLFSYTNLPHFYYSELAQGIYRDIHEKDGHKDRSVIYSTSYAPGEMDWILDVKNLVEEYSPSRTKYSRVMIHLYQSHADSLGWHSDREGDEEIASANFGVRRKFQLRSKSNTDDHPIDFYLGDGDLLYMHGPARMSLQGEDGVVLPSCQQSHKHRVPPVGKTTIKDGTRVNMTFRIG